MMIMMMIRWWWWWLDVVIGEWCVLWTAFQDLFEFLIDFYMEILSDSFDIKINGRLIFSKAQLGHYPDFDEIVEISKWGNKVPKTIYCMENTQKCLDSCLENLHIFCFNFIHFVSIFSDEVCVPTQYDEIPIFEQSKEERKISLIKSGSHSKNHCLLCYWRVQYICLHLLLITVDFSLGCLYN